MKKYSFNISNINLKEGFLNFERNNRLRLSQYKEIKNNFNSNNNNNNNNFKTISYEVVESIFSELNNNETTKKNLIKQNQELDKIEKSNGIEILQEKMWKRVGL